MATSIGIGFSQHPDVQEAALQACIQIKKQLNTPDTDFILAFASPEYIVPETQWVIARTLKPKRLIGFPTGSIILANALIDKGLALLGINSDDIRLGIAAVTETVGKDLHYTGFDLARKTALDLNSSQRELFIAFSQGADKNCSQFIRGIKESLGGGFPILGTLPNDDFKYKNLPLLFQDKILQNSSIGLILGGTFHLGLGSGHGFKPLGKPRTATKVDGTILRSIDNKPAFEIYKHFLGAEAVGLKSTSSNAYAAMYPLGAYIQESRQYLLRNIVDILDDGSIVCHEGIPEGAEIHLMISNTDSCYNSAVKAAELVKESLADRPAKLLLIFESFARHRIMGRQTFEYIETIKKILGNNIPILGMCCHGEIGPFGGIKNIKNIYLFNENILMAAIA